jgi:CBS-domain-containing membrane protein
MKDVARTVELKIRSRSTRPGKNSSIESRLDLKATRPLCEKTDEACALPEATMKLKELVIPFAGTVQPDDSILKALDIMMDHDVSRVPVMQEGKLQGIEKLSRYLQYRGRSAVR